VSFSTYPWQSDRGARQRQLQELSQGVCCIHLDFRVGGLKAGETKKLHGKLYLMENDITRLLTRYYHDFGK